MAVRADHLLYHLHRLIGRSVADPAGDAALIERFTRHGDEEAFSSLVARHGPMVFGVCRRVLHDPHTAEDVFQATFLVLARKAGTLHRPEALAAWLHGTARRLALKCRRSDVRRRDREARCPVPPPSPTADPLEELSAREMLLALDEEIQRLPEAYRLPLILCGLAGHTQEEAARMLGWTSGSVKGRLERGRARLHSRLVRRGLTLPAGLLAGGAVAGGPVAVRAGLVTATSRAARAFVAGAEGVPAGARALAEQALGASAGSGMKIGLALLLIAAAGVGILASWLPGPPQSKERPPQWPRSRDEKVTRTDRLGDPLPPGAIARLGTIRLRPGGQLVHLAFSPDGKRLASWTYNQQLPGRLSIHDPATGRELRDVEMPGGMDVSLSWLKDGRCLALPSFGERTFVWDFMDETARLPSGAAPPASPIKAATTAAVRMGATTSEDREFDQCYAIAPNGELLAVGRGGSRADRERPILLRSLTVGRSIEELKPLPPLGPQPGTCDALRFTPDSRHLLAFSGRREATEDTLIVWDVGGRKKLRQMTVPRALQQGGVKVCAVAPDGQTLALGLADGTARLWDLRHGRETHSIRVVAERTAPSPYHAVSAIAFTPDGEHLVTGGHDHFVRVWETASGREVWGRPGHARWVEALAVSPDGKRIASGGQDGSIRIWDAATGADACPLEGHQFVVWGVAVSADGRRAVTSGGDGSVRVWDADTGRQMRRIEVEGRLTGLFSYAPGGGSLLGGSAYRLHLLDPTTGGAAELPKALADEAAGRALFAPDGRTLVTIHRGEAEDQGEAAVWEWPAGRLLRRLKLRPEIADGTMCLCLGLAISPDGRKLITLTEPINRGNGPPPPEIPAAADLWDIASGKRLRRLRASTTRTSDVAFTPDGTGVFLAAGPSVYYQETGRPDALSLVDLRTGQTRRAFAAPAKGTTEKQRQVHALALSPDGRTVASVERDSSVLLFEVATGLPRRRLVGHRGRVTALAFTPEGERLITTGTVGTGLVWDVSLSALAPRTDATPEQLWNDLASLKADRANRALAALADAPDTAVALFRQHLRPADSPTPAAINRLIADLDSDRFEVRRKAFAELDRMGEEALPALRSRIDRGEPLEVRRQIEQLLEKHGSDVTADRVRQIRALEVLEQIDTPEARDLLAALANGAEEAPRTLDARASLKRLATRLAVRR